MAHGSKGISKEKIAEIKRLRSSGLTMKQVAEIVGVSVCTVRWHCNAKSREYIKNRRKERRNELFNYRDCLKNVKFEYVTKETLQMAERLLRQVPPDTRDLTGKLCGDPLPGRSALDRMQNA